MNEIKESQHNIPSRDGFPLSAIALQPAQVRAAVLLAGGTGIKKEFYLNYARYLAAHGYAVLLFDYRGIGGSRPASLSGFHAHNHEWGLKDMAAMLDWLQQHYPQLPKALIGHSAGGQQLGFADNHALLSKALLISSSTGYWRNLASPYKYFTLAIWYMLVPATSSLVGYVPASWFKLGEDLPKGVANEWRSWCLSPSYFRAFFGSKIPITYFDNIRIPLHFLFPEDDLIATERSVNQLRAFYTSAPTTTEKVMLADHGLKAVGHLGYFSRKAQQALWPKTLAFLEDLK